MNCVLARSCVLLRIDAALHVSIIMCAFTQRTFNGVTPSAATNDFQRARCFGTRKVAICLRKLQIFWRRVVVKVITPRTWFSQLKFY